MKSGNLFNIFGAYHLCLSCLMFCLLILSSFINLSVCSAQKAKPPDKTVILFTPFENYSKQTHLHTDMCVALQNIFSEKYLTNANLHFTYKDEPFKTNSHINYIIETTIHEIEMRHGIKSLFIKKFKGAIVPVEINIIDTSTGTSIYHETITARGDQSPPIGGAYGFLFGLSDKNTIAKAFEKLAIVIPQQLPDL